MANLINFGGRSLFDDFFRDVAPGYFVKPLHGDPLPAQIKVDIREDGGAYTVLDRPGEPLTAEVSFTVEEDYHGQGLSGLFMRLLTQIGRQRGIRRFEAEMLAGNAPMLKVFQRSGLPLSKHIEDGVVRVVMALDEAAPA